MVMVLLLKGLLMLYKDSVEEVEQEFQEMYPHLNSHIENGNVRKVFNELLTIEEKEANFIVRIEEGKCMINKKITYGFKAQRYSSPENKLDTEDNDYSLSFISWDEILGMEIDERILIAYRPTKILAVMIHEMTVYGFDSKSVQSQKNDFIKAILNNYKGEDLNIDDEDEIKLYIVSEDDEDEDFDDEDTEE